MQLQEFPKFSLCLVTSGKDLQVGVVRGVSRALCEQGGGRKFSSLGRLFPVVSLSHISSFHFQL